MICATPQQSLDVGASLGGRLKSGDVVAIYGELGVGKTLFVRGMAVGMGIKRRVISPTFVIISEYDGSPPLCHIDLYRIADRDEAEALDLRGHLYDDAVVAIEWPECIEALLPAHTVTVRIKIVQRGARRIDITEGSR